MENIEQTRAIHNTLNDYATALNTAEIESIPTFYATDGMFMPDGYPTISKSANLKRAAENYLIKSAFNIKYVVDNILIDQDLAFVNAQADTLQKDKVTGGVISQSTRDFFILKRSDGSWKIYRYMFNNVTRRA